MLSIVYVSDNELRKLATLFQSLLRYLYIFQCRTCIEDRRIVMSDSGQMARIEDRRFV